jgi:hypothetical protein
MVETWEHVCGVPMFYHVRRIPMDALDVETRSCLQTLITSRYTFEVEWR